MAKKLALLFGAIAVIAIVVALYLGNPADSTNPPKESFYGEWVLTRVLAYGPVGTYSIEEATNLVNKTLTFAEENATCFGDQASDIDKVVTNPAYTNTVISKDDFLQSNRISLTELGVEADSISEITVSDSTGIVCTFLVKDDNTLIVYGGGTYFELIRAEA